MERYELSDVSDPEILPFAEILPISDLLTLAFAPVDAVHVYTVFSRVNWIYQPARYRNFVSYGSM